MTPLATSLDDWCAATPPGKGVLVVDQFEEVITLGNDKGAREGFERKLAAVVAAGQRVILTLRSDFEPQFPGTSLLVPYWRDEARFTVILLGQEELREVILGPATARALSFQPPEAGRQADRRGVADARCLAAPLLHPERALHTPAPALAVPGPPGPGSRPQRGRITGTSGMWPAPYAPAPTRSSRRWTRRIARPSGACCCGWSPWSVACRPGAGCKWTNCTTQIRPSAHGSMRCSRASWMLGFW